ncbi:hypothetical protein GW750_09515 [bacterium]|nr:hypothetical protein [bacterium]
MLHTTKNKIVSLTDFSTTSFLLHEFLGSKCTADFVRFIKNKLHKENLPIRDIIQ